MESKEKMQLQMELQILNQEMTKMNEHIQQVHAQMEELSVTEETIEELPELKKDNEVLIPISSGIYAKATITDTDTTFINTGASVFVDKTIDETKNLISEQKEKLEQYMQQIQMQMQHFHSRMHEIQEQLS